MTDPRTIKADAGFSLIELLVAVAILALAAVTLLESQSQAIGMTSAVEQRALAAIVAENRLNLAVGQKAEPLPGSRSGTETQMGMAFTWRETIRKAQGGDLMQVTVDVSASDAAGTVLARLTGYRKAA